MNNKPALQHVNRKGEAYYLQEGKTRTGKPKYYAARKLTGAPLDAVPDGYEIHEKPETAQVVVRKVKASPITEFERKQTEEIVRRASGLDHVIVDIEDNALVVYTPSVNRADSDRLIEKLAGPFLGLMSSRVERFREEWIKHSQYMKMLRFELVDTDERVYHAERWCFRGSIDNWFPLFGSGPLPVLVEKYAKHLDRESFYELM